MIANTRWMTATDLADRLDVHPNAVRNAVQTKGRCANFRIQRRAVKPGEDYGRAKFVFRGIDGALKKSDSPAVTDRPPSTRPVGGAESKTPVKSESGETAWMKQQDLAVEIGCQPKTVRNSWEKKSRVSGFNIERRAVKSDEEFGRARYVYRGVPAKPGRRKRGSKPAASFGDKSTWMTASDLADALGVHSNSIRAAVDRDILAAGYAVKRRPAKKNEVSDGRVRFLFSAYRDDSKADTSKPAAAAPEEAQKTEEAPKKTSSNTTRWMSCAALSKHLDVHNNAIRLAHDNKHLCRGYRITRRPVKPSDNVDGRTRYLFRGTQEADVDASFKPGPRAAAKPAATPAKPAKTATPTAPKAATKSTPKVAPAASTAPAPAAWPADASFDTLLSFAAQHCLENPDEASYVFRFLGAYSNR